MKHNRKEQNGQASQSVPFARIVTLREWDFLSQPRTPCRYCVPTPSAKGRPACVAVVQQTRAYAWGWAAVMPETVRVRLWEDNNMGGVCAVEAFSRRLGFVERLNGVELRGRDYSCNR